MDANEIAHLDFIALHKMHACHADMALLLF